MLRAGRASWNRRWTVLGLTIMLGCRSVTDAGVEENAPVPDENPPVEMIVPSTRCATALGRFGGLQWMARTQGLSGPGPNVWNACQAWLDTDGLHLRLDRVGGVWTSAEVYTTDVVGYGRLEFEITTPLGALDPNVVLGMFTYPGAGLDGLHEIDIEVARFGNASATATNLNYVVYPGATPKGSSGLCKQRWTAPPGPSIHRFLWTPNAATFQSFSTTPIFSNTVPDRSWRFVPTGSVTISSGQWPLHINLWLYGGRAPLNGQPVDVVIRRVTYVTSLPTTPTASTNCP